MHIWNPTEERSPVDQLTPGQRECLRLVQQLQSSKQIARKLGISNYTVDQRLMLACRKLGVRSRAEAALMLAAHDRRHDRDTADQFNPPVSDAFASSLPLPLPAAIKLADEKRARADNDPLPAEQPARSSSAHLSLPLPNAQHMINRLSVGERIGWTFAISFSSIIAFGVLLGALAALNMLL